MIDVRAAIVAEALARFPEEACGLLLATGTTVIAENVSPDRSSNFVVDPLTADRWWPTGQVTGVWHSHCYGPAVPSDADQVLAHPGLECWIYSVPDEQLAIYRPDEDGRLQLVSMDEEFVVTLTCGCSFSVYAHDGEERLRQGYAVGYWFSCPGAHSAPVSYDPDTGEPRKYERNQQAVSVERRIE